MDVVNILYFIFHHPTSA